MGHWEGHTIIGAAHKQAIVTLVERKSGFAVLAKVPNKSADLVSWAIEAKLKPLNSRVKTLTVDNGKEFADHQAIDQALGIQTYFADPYCNWQRSSNENFNGLLRQYIPKKRRMETVTDEELNMIENRLNHRPRKRLAECEMRDVKGLYAKARLCELKNFTGIDSPYEAPDTSEVHLFTQDRTAEACVDELMRWTNVAVER